MTHRDIPGWCDFEALYFEQVRRAKDGAHFVEVGSFLGRSTAYMATQIKESGKAIQFDAVDNWKCEDSDCMRKASELVGGNVLGQFMSNMESCGVSDCVRAIQADSCAAAETYEDNSIDFVFIDATHSDDAVQKDMSAWWPKVKPGGLMAGHDYEEVKNGVDGFAERNCLAVYGDGANTPKGFKCWGIPKPMAEPANILLALPTYNGQSEIMGTLVASSYSYSGPGSVTLRPQSTSLLASNFNSLWCMAMNEPSITHFAMLHADIVPMNWWLNVLMHELVATGSQMVSTVVPIKDQFGVTSTGIRDPNSPWAPYRRFTIAEVLTMPATFDAAQAGYPDKNMVLNTGCWLADLRHPAWRTENGDGELEIRFTINDRIKRIGDKYIPFCEPEDFHFSNRAQELGMKVVATRKVQVRHLGPFSFTNDALWGKWTSDEATKANWDEGQTHADTQNIER